MDVSIIIVNYNTLGLTSDCIESIVDKTSEKFFQYAPRQRFGCNKVGYHRIKFGCSELRDHAGLPFPERLINKIIRLLVEQLHISGAQKTIRGGSACSEKDNNRK